jgi:hypothetical protein
MYRLNPGGISSYLSTCSYAEHFLAYRELVRDQISRQLDRHLAVEPQAASRPPVAAAPANPQPGVFSLPILAMPANVA